MHVFATVAMKVYNGAGAKCDIAPNHPPHCIGYKSGHTPEGFSIPCGRGGGGDNSGNYRVAQCVGMGMLFSPPIVIVGTMLLMYRSVAKIEKNMRNYGVNALRLDARRSGGTNNHGQNAANDQGIMRGIKRLLVYMISSLHCDDHPASRSNSVTSQKRAILLLATGYALAWFLTYTPFYILVFGVEYPATWILHVCLPPPFNVSSTS